MPDMRRLANEIELLSDENRRELNAALIAGGSTRIVSDSHHIDGYRELAQKCSDLERERDEAVAEVRRLRAKLGIDVGEISVEGVIWDSGTSLCRAGDELRERFQRANHAVACLDYWSRP